MTGVIVLWGVCVTALLLLNALRLVLRYRDIGGALLNLIFAGIFSAATISHIMRAST